MKLLSSFDSISNVIYGMYKLRIICIYLVTGTTNGLFIFYLWYYFIPSLFDYYSLPSDIFLPKGSVKWFWLGLFFGESCAALKDLGFEGYFCLGL